MVEMDQALGEAARMLFQRVPVDWERFEREQSPADKTEVYRLCRQLNEANDLAALARLGRLVVHYVMFHTTPTPQGGA